MALALLFVARLARVADAANENENVTRRAAKYSKAKGNARRDSTTERERQLAALLFVAGILGVRDASTVLHSAQAAPDALCSSSLVFLCRRLERGFELKPRSS